MRDTVMATSLSPSVQSGACTARGAVSAPLFHELVKRVRSGGRWVVFDLGAARSRTVALFGQFRCRLEIADLAQGLELLNRESDPGRLREKVEALLPARREEPIDIILCWNFLNYLNRPALTSLMECVAARARPGALAHALVVYAAKRMPVVPGGFVPLEDRRLIDIGACGDERDAPRYSPDDLARCMPDYSVERGRLLRNGMQEFLFQR